MGDEDQHDSYQDAYNKGYWNIGTPDYSNNESYQGFTAGQRQKEYEGQQAEASRNGSSGSYTPSYTPGPSSAGSNPIELGANLAVLVQGFGAASASGAFGILAIFLEGVFAAFIGVSALPRMSLTSALFAGAGFFIAYLIINRTLWLQPVLKFLIPLSVTALFFSQATNVHLKIIHQGEHLAFKLTHFTAAHLKHFKWELLGPMLAGLLLLSFFLHQSAYRDIRKSKLARKAERQQARKAAKEKADPSKNQQKA